MHLTGVDFTREARAPFAGTPAEAGHIGVGTVEI
jgi:hypothetical protein